MNISREQPAEPVRLAEFAQWQLQLLPRAAYEANYTTSHAAIGYSFEQQFGVHAFASDRRQAFLAKPEGLAYVPADCDVYSQSTTGGEYLRVVNTDSSAPMHSSQRHFSNATDSFALQAAKALRRHLISDCLEPLQLEHWLLVLQAQTALFLGDKPLLSTESSWMTAHRFKKIDEFIESHLDCTLTITEIAHKSGLSEGFFHRQFKSYIGKSPHQYIIDKRLARARQMLLHRTHALSEIALDCGFSSHSHMSAQFQARFGISPTRLQEHVTNCNPKQSTRISANES